MRAIEITTKESGAAFRAKKYTLVRGTTIIFHGWTTILSDDNADAIVSYAPGSSSVGQSAILIQSWSKVRSLPAGLRRLYVSFRTYKERNTRSSGSNPS